MGKIFNKKIVIKGNCFLGFLLFFIIFENRLLGKQYTTQSFWLCFTWILFMAFGFIWSIEYDKNNKEAHLFDFDFKVERFPHFIKNEPVLNARALLVFESFALWLFVVVSAVKGTIFFT